MATLAADTRDYVIADIGLADFGRKEINIAETEMPGLMALRSEFGASQPLKGARIVGSLHMTIQTCLLYTSREANDARFCRDIGRIARRRAEPFGRGDVDDARGVALAQPWQGGADHALMRGQHYRDRAVPDRLLFVVGVERSEAR